MSIATRRKNWYKEGWTAVELSDHFIRKGIGSLSAERIIDKEIVPWCKENIKGEAWEIGGVTRYTFRIQFKNAEDCLFFKLALGF